MRVCQSYFQHSPASLFSLFPYFFSASLNILRNFCFLEFNFLVPKILLGKREFFVLIKYCFLFIRLFYLFVFLLMYMNIKDVLLIKRELRDFPEYLCRILEILIA